MSLRSLEFDVNWAADLLAQFEELVVKLDLTEVELRTKREQYSSLNNFEKEGVVETLRKRWKKLEEARTQKAEFLALLDELSYAADLQLQLLKQFDEFDFFERYDAIKELKYKKLLRDHPEKQAAIEEERRTFSTMVQFRDMMNSNKTKFSAEDILDH
jgi:hypothetical protein